MRRRLPVYGFLCLFCLVNTGQAVAQVDADEDFDAYLSAIVSDFYAFEDSINLDFANFLEQAWQPFTVYEGTEPPAYSAGWKQKALTIGEEVEPITEAVASPAITFFGTHIALASFPGQAFSLSDVSEKWVADGWRRLASEDFASFLNTCRQYSGKLSLNDWGRYLLLREVCYRGYPSLSSSERTLFLFYLLSHSGYKVKIGRGGENRLVLLLPFREEVYRMPYIRVGEMKYYLTDVSSLKLKELYSFQADYPAAHAQLSLSVQRPLRFPEEATEPKAPRKGNLGMELNKNILDFYATYPYCDLSIYFRAKPSEDFDVSLSRRIETQLRDKSRLECVAWLLDFVQQSFSHKPDKDVHGREVYYFPEETFFYPYADCEDLSVFLSFLLNRFTDRQVLTLYYPSHVAVAVENCEGYKGEVLTYGGRTYFVCDPSYKGAKPGNVIPSCAAIKPVIVSYFNRREK